MRTWLLVIALLGSLVAVSTWVSGPDNKPQLEELNQQLPPAAEGLKTATKEPGRVVELNTTRGKIEFVLLEKDCPKTTERIAELVKDGSYNGVRFGRVVKDFVIQTDAAKRPVKPMGCEVLKGLTHSKGAVGMARKGRDYKSNTSEFYITLEPSPHLDQEYTVFGRVIVGMDVALKIKQGDLIRTAKIRSLTDADRKRFFEVLQIESERKTQ